MATNTIRRVERFARELVEDLHLTSMAEFSAEDIDFIAASTQVSFTEVVDILAAELV